MKKIATISLLLILVGAATLLPAQVQAPHTPPSPAVMAQHRVSYLTTILSLTPEQQQQATTIYTTANATNSSLWTQLRSARQSLEAAIQKNDTAGINQLSSEIGALVARQTLAEATAKAALFQTLTPDQQTKLTQLEGQRHGMGFARGGF